MHVKSHVPKRYGLTLVTFKATCYQEEIPTYTFISLFLMKKLSGVNIVPAGIVLPL